ncbi:DUF6139 family protein [Noviherbaspirillum pedocola]|uniref:Uncharacterized protein n=1 Tax=Noviherbaspirillum pedocola TaxID=2801341 RepID=A0A934SXB6_9BURK|nr:DUF6139 family protein [Noviherbaspirillum pedocola]MBK4737208.1 hypothetical protein [Noviherbaspirillum pedocola]
MRLDIYKRPESGGKFSYLAVPEGKAIPQEAISVDWEIAERAVNVDDNADDLPKYSIETPLRQIRDKAYAITSVATLGDPTPMP